MTLDFSGQNLRRRSFKGQNLKDANFKYADIRSVDFSNAILENVDFTGVKAGLSPRNYIGLVIVSLILSAISGFTAGIFGIFAGIMLSPEYTSKYTIFPSVFVLVVFLILSITTILRGIVVPLAFLAVVFFILIVGGYVGIYGFQGALAVVGASTYFAVCYIFGGFAFTLAGILNVALLIASAIFALVSATFFIVAVTAAGVDAGVDAHFIFVAVAGAAPIAAVGAIAGLILSGYVAWQALASNEKYAFLRKASVAFAAIRGTSFRGADLTDADFTIATLKNTDFREAILIRTSFHKTKKLDLVRPGNTYLQNSQVRQLVMTKKGRNLHFDRLDLRGVNLQGANLENASFIDADFYQASLKGANLSGAKLVRTNFERADLTDTNLTGSCIQDWVITESTKLDRIICNYVFLKWVSKIEEGLDKGHGRDQMPPRSEFTDSGFTAFVKSILHTVELYHERKIDSKLALSALLEISKEYDESLDIVAIGQRGEQKFIRVSNPKNISTEKFKNEYYSRYEKGLSMSPADNNELLPFTDAIFTFEDSVNQINSSKESVYIGSTHYHINRRQITSTNYYEISNTGQFNMSGDHNINMGDGNYNERIEGDYIQQQGSFGVGVNKGKIKGEKIAGTINEAQQKNLAEVAAEIQALLQQLEKSYPTDTTAGKMAIATEALARIEGDKSLSERVLSALKAGGVSAFEQLLNHPAASFVIGALEDWQKTKGG